MNVRNPLQDTSNYFHFCFVRLVESGLNEVLYICAAAKLHHHVQYLEWKLNHLRRPMIQMFKSRMLVCVHVLLTFLYSTRIPEHYITIVLKSDVVPKNYAIIIIIIFLQMLRQYLIRTVILCILHPQFVKLLYLILICNGHIRN